MYESSSKVAYVLRPKPKRAPERESANEWYAPAAMRAMGTPASERTSCGISQVLPAPDVVPGPVNETDAAGAVVGETGCSVPMPSCPKVFEPQAKSSPPAACSP